MMWHGMLRVKPISINGASAQTLEAKDGKYTISADILKTAGDGKLNIRVIVVPDPTVTFNGVTAYDVNGDQITKAVTAVETEDGFTLSFSTTSPSIKVVDSSDKTTDATLKMTDNSNGLYYYTLSGITENVTVKPNT